MTRAGRGGGTDRRRTASGAMHPRLRQRVTTVRRRPLRLLLPLLLVAALVAAVVVVFGYSRAFVVRDVVVEGASGRLAEDVVERADVPSGQPLARVSTADVTDRVLQDPRFATVDVARGWPSTITLDVKVRQPALALVRGADAEEGELAADDGVVYRGAGPVPDDLPRLRVPEDEEQVPRAAVTGALALYAALPDPVSDEVSTVRWSSGGEMRFSLGQVSVTWGRAGRAEDKGRVLQALLAQEEIDPEGATSVTVDLAAPDTPVVGGLPEPMDEEQDG